MHDVNELIPATHGTSGARRKSRALRAAQARTTVEALSARSELRDNLYDVLAPADSHQLIGDKLPLPWHHTSHQHRETPPMRSIDSKTSLAKRSMT